MKVDRPRFVTPELYYGFHDIYRNCTPADLRFHKLLLLTGRYDKSVGGIIAYWEMVRDILGRGRIKDLIECWADRQGIRVYVIPGDRISGKASLVFAEYPPELVDLAREHRVRSERREWRQDDLVDFETGRACTEKVLRRAREDYNKIIAEQTADPRHPAADLLNWLNTMPTRAQTELMARNKPHVVEAILSEPRGYREPKCRKGKPLLHADGSPVMGPDHYMARYDHNLRCFSGMHDYPYIRYKTVGGTPRLYSDSLGALSFTRNIREVAYQGCWNLDLKAAHIGILAALGDCAGIQSFLSAKGDWWQKLQQFLGVGPGFKPILKVGTYSIPYGAEVNTIRYNLHQGEFDTPGLPRSKAAQFLENPFIAELLEARERLFAQIIADGGKQDAFGRTITLEQTGRDDPRRAAKSVLACVAQSYELRIMAAVKPVIESDAHTHLVGWLHDGIILRITRNADSMIRSLQSAVDTELATIALEQGYVIHTRLESKELGATTLSAHISIAA